MRKIHIQARAKQDLKNIWLYSFKNWGHPQADKYYDELIEGITVIVNNPKIGINRDDIRQGYRQYHINRHMVFYRLTPTRINVVRILGDSMDVERHV
jgi:toxin ParE1/3/4